ncbi:MAG: TAXI family TRAP transporter solute-binding subunit [Polyangiales bacterium]
MSTAESEAVLSRIIGYLQSNAKIRIGIGLVLVGALLFFAGRAVLQLMPRHFTLTASGGDIVDNRHFVARAVQAESPKHGVTMVLRPTSGTIASLEKVSKGELDLAFVQGGLDRTFPNVEQVAVVMPEFLHLLVKPTIHTLGELKGHSVNLGAKNSGGHSVAQRIMEFAAHKPNIDYVETNFAPEELLALPERKMPDALFVVSSIPSYLVESLVNDHGYRLVEIPFPQSLALRYGWAGTGKILAYTYSVDPPVPERDIATVAINMYLVAGSKVDPEAVEKVLETLFTPSVQSRLHTTLDEKAIGTPSGYPISAATTLFLKRDESFLTLDMWNKATSLFGLFMSFSGMGIVLLKWFRGAPAKPVFHDDEFRGYLAEAARVEREIEAMESASRLDRLRLLAMRDTLNGLHAKLLERYPDASLSDAKLFDCCADSIRFAREHVASALAQAAPTTSNEERAT